MAEPSTSRIGDYLTDFICQICSSPAGASRHFGATSCLACAAFFRRTVTLGLEFSCIGQGKKKDCKIYYEQRIVCKGCRYERCIAAGMMPQHVQKRRVTGSKTESQPLTQVSKITIKPQVENSTRSVICAINEVPSNQSASSSSTGSVESQVGSTTTDLSESVDEMVATFRNILSKFNLLDHYVNEEQKIMDRRKVMFSASPMDVLLGNHAPIPFLKTDLTPFTIKAHSNNMRFDHLLSVEYCKQMPGLDLCSENDKVTVFRYNIIGVCVLDIAFITIHMDLYKDGCLVFPNATYLSIRDYSFGWEPEEDITHEAKIKLFSHITNAVQEFLVTPMISMNLNQTEFAALKILTLWKACYFELSPPAKLLAIQQQNLIIRDLHNYYQDFPNGPQRLGEIILFIGNIIELYKLIIEHYKKIELFNLFKIDIFLRDLLRL